MMTKDKKEERERGERGEGRGGWKIRLLIFTVRPMMSLPTDLTLDFMPYVNDLTAN